MVDAGTWERNAIKLEKNGSWSLGAASKESKWQLKVLPKAQLDCKRVWTAVRHEGTKGKGLPQYPELVSPPPKILNRFFLSATSAVCTFFAKINHYHLHLQSIDTCLFVYRYQISLLHLLSLTYLLTCLQKLAMRLLQFMQKI